MRLNSREQFLRLDVEDPLASIREQFDLPPRLIYLDGNSLGAMPREARNRLSEAMGQWAHGLISSWNNAGWAEAPIRVGDKLGRLLGARPSEVVLGDTTSVNLYKALSAALSLHPGGAILTDEQNFPTDLYIAEAVAKKWGVELRRVPRHQLGEAIQHGVAVVTVTHVDYRTGHMLDLRELTKAAHDAGALFVWDLCHSAGAVPLDLNGAEVDLAVGCTYKFLNGGPGAPAYTFAARRFHGDLNNPIPGWFGHDHPFDFDSGYRPAPDARRFLTGTPAILSVAALEAAIDLWLSIDIAMGRSNSLVLADLLIDQDQGLGSHHGDVDAEPQVDCRFERGHRQDRGSSSEESSRVRCRLVTTIKVKWVVVSEPAWDRIVQVAVEPASSEGVGRRAWTAVQELIGASDCQVHLGAVEIKRHRTSAVTEIPNEQRARIVSGLCELAQVQHVSRPIVHVRDRDHGHAMLDGFAELVAGDAPKLYAPFLRYRLCDVQVGRKVLLIGKDRSTGVQTERRAQGFVEVDGRRVAQHHLRWARAEQAPYLVAHSYGSLGPTGVIPTR